MVRIIAFCAVVLVTIPTPLTALPYTAEWAATTTRDVVAAHALIAENHPGAVPQLRDKTFRRHLARARRVALEAARRARTEADYRLILRAFAASFSDSHIAWRPVADGRVAAIAQPKPSVRTVGHTLIVALPALNAAARGTLPQVAAALAGDNPPNAFVIDARGNGGGDSAIGDTLIRMIYGGNVPVLANGCPVAWRASSGNARELAQAANAVAATERPRAAALAVEAERLREALRNGAPFAVAITPRCLVRAKPALASIVESGRNVTVVTDGRCFSSCLLMVESLRALGARQAGSPTAAGNWFMEVRSERLPSGLGSFSTLQKVDLRRSATIGPFEPDAPLPDALLYEVNPSKGT